MIHFASPSFWSAYDSLPNYVQHVADQNYKTLKSNPKQITAKQITAKQITEANNWGQGKIKL